MQSKDLSSQFDYMGDEEKEETLAIQEEIEIFVCEAGKSILNLNR